MQHIINKLNVQHEAKKRLDIEFQPAVTTQAKKIK